MGNRTPDYFLRYKSVSPLATVKRIQSILDQHEILVKETQWWNMGSALTPSLAVQLDRLPFTVYGKGISDEFARASAYAELMERLQNVYSVNNKLRHGVIKSPDSIMLEAKKLSALVDKNICNKYLLDLIVQRKQLIYSTKFVHISAQGINIEYLPEALLMMVAGSNGLCAGNNIVEALIQGFCEICERYILSKIYDDPATSFPIIPNAMLCDRTTNNYYLELKKLGYQVTIRDCSLGKYPVVGLFLTKGGRFRYNLGAAPDFFIALERCFTEILQEKNLHEFDQFLLEHNSVAFKNREEELRYWLLQKRKAFVFYAGDIRKELLSNKIMCSGNNLFSFRAKSDNDTLKNLITLIIAQGYEIYIRDSSFLGFPAFRVYIPQMSGMITSQYYDREIQSDIAKATPIIKNLGNYGEKDIEFLIKTINAMKNNPHLFTEDEKSEYILPIFYNLLPEEHSRITINDVMPYLYFYVDRHSPAIATSLAKSCDRGSALFADRQILSDILNQQVGNNSNFNCLSLYRKLQNAIDNYDFSQTTLLNYLQDKVL